MLGVHQDLIRGGEPVLRLLEEVGEDRHRVWVADYRRGLGAGRAQDGSFVGLPGSADELLGLSVDWGLSELDQLDEALEVAGSLSRDVTEDRKFP